MHYDVIEGKFFFLSKIYLYAPWHNAIKICEVFNFLISLMTARYRSKGNVPEDDLTIHEMDWCAGVGVEGQACKEQ